MHTDFHDMKALRTALLALPDFAPPPGAWDGARARSATRHVSRVDSPSRLAMAASLVAMLAAALLFSGRPAPGGAVDRPIPLAAPLDELVAQNARLEAALADLPRTSTTRVGTAYTVAALEDRLALLDDRITAVSLEPSAPETAEELWRQRVSVMNSLVQVQYANVMASR